MVGHQTDPIRPAVSGTVEKGPGHRHIVVVQEQGLVGRVVRQDRERVADCGGPRKGGN